MLLEIHEATPDDAEGIVAILTPIIAARIHTAFDTPFSVDAEREFLRTFPERGVFLVAVEQDGRIVGFQSLSPFAGYTRAFDHVGVIGTFVDLRRRRQGIATGLFDAMFRAAPKKGYEKIFTFVRADNHPALQTYRRQGFQVVGTARRQAKIDGRYVDEIIIERILTGDGRESV